MLFINFLCLLYLMVLVTGHTISKSVENEDDIEGILDSLNDGQLTRDARLRNDRFLHKFRRGNPHETTTPLPRTKATLSTAKKPKSTPETTVAVKITNITKPISTIMTTRASSKKHKPKHGLVNFWKKFKYKKNRTAIKTGKDTPSKGDITLYNAIRDVRRLKKRRRKNNNQFYLDGYTFYSPERDNYTRKEREDSQEIYIRPYQHYPQNTKYYKTDRIVTPERVNFQDVTSQINAMTTKLNHLKRLYGIDKFGTKEYTLTSVTSDSPEVDEIEFPGTAQIEVLLNDIKKKAVQMLAEQNPVLTDIIMNTATEATFEADSDSSPNYALTTFITMNGVNNINKRTAETINKLNDTHPLLYTTPRSLRARSIGAEALTIARSVEDMLQKELKSAFNKLKHRVSTDLNKEITTAKSTVKKGTKKLNDKFARKHNNCNLKTSLTVPSFPVNSTTPMPSTIRKEKKTPRVTNVTKLTTTSKFTHTTPTNSTYDDFALLTMYEQMMTKAHGNLVIPSNAVFQSRRKRRENLRNPETLTDLSLKEHIRKIYEDGEEMPEEVNYAEEPSSNTNSNDDRTPSEDRDGDQTDTSFQGLSNKISFNDYVNGYKHYLKFQKQLDEPQWSNQIKYQAHRHHSVDDIGKFILNKLPHVPATKRYRRHFFEDTDNMDDQDVSTKSDDSWFKKHFYLFIETRPPKKFHNTQTVSLKSPVTKSVSSVKSNSERERLRKGITEVTDSNEVNLDDLSKALCEKAAMPASPSEQDNPTTDFPQFRRTKQAKHNNKLYKKDLAIPKFIEKIFRNPKPNTTTAVKKPHKPNKDLKMNVIDDLVEDLDRRKRDETTEAYIYSSTPASLHKKDDSKKYGYVNIDLVPRTTAAHKTKDKKRGKLRRFFSKFRFRKKQKHTSKKAKRQVSTRIERFNPFKKLKDIFGGKAQNTPAVVPDYDILTTRQVSLKPARFHEFPNIDAMKSQVPNISYDFANDLPPLPETEKAIKSTTRNIINTDTTEGAGYLPADSTDFNFTSMGGRNSELKTTRKLYRPQYAHKYESGKVDRIPNQNYKSMKPVGSGDMYSTTSPMTLEQMRNEVDDLRFTLSTMDFSVTTPSNILRTVKSRKIAIKSKSPSSQGGLSSMRSNFVTFPVNEKNSGYSSTVKQYTNFTPRKRAKIKAAKSKIDFIDKATKAYPIRYNNMPEKTTIDQTSIGNDKKLKVVPDYFNDLLMWHRDILEIGSIGNPTWDAIEKDLGDETGLTTPNVEALQKETTMNYLQMNGMKSKKEQKRKPNRMLLMTQMGNQIIKSNMTSKPGMVVATMDKDNIVKGKDTEGYGVRKNNQERSVKQADQTIFTTGVAKMEHRAPGKHSFMKNGFTLRDENDDAGINSNNGPSAIFVDTTILSYDDAVNYVTAGLEIKKLSKNSLQSKTSKSSYIQHENPKHSKMQKRPHYKPQPIAKTYKQPVQYFTTPLPMRMHDFERFLKDNNLDVESVTSPHIELPSFVDLWGGKLGHRDTNTKPARYNEVLNKMDSKEGITNQIAKVAVTKSNPNPAVPVIVKVKTNTDNLSEIEAENQIEYLEKLGIDLSNDYNYEYDDRESRVKRYDRYNSYYDDKDLNYDPTKRDALRSNYYNKIKKKFFEKKATSRSTTEQMDFRDALVTSNDTFHGDMEITIINLDDINKKFETDRGLSSEVLYHTTVKDEENKLSNTKTTIVTPKKAIPTRNLMISDKQTLKTRDKTDTSYEKMFQELNEMINSSEKSKPYKDVNFKKLFTPLPDDSARFTVSTPAPQSPDVKPKRIQISSHCYKYDVFYNEPPVSKTSKDKNLLFTPRSFTKAVRKSSKHSETEESDLTIRPGTWFGNARLVREAESNESDLKKTPEETKFNLLKKLNFFTKVHDKLKFFVSSLSTKAVTRPHMTKPTRTVTRTSTAKSTDPSPVETNIQEQNPNEVKNKQSPLAIQTVKTNGRNKAETLPKTRLNDRTTNAVTVKHTTEAVTETKTIAETEKPLTEVTLTTVIAPKDKLTTMIPHIARVEAENENSIVTKAQIKNTKICPETVKVVEAQQTTTLKSASGVPSNPDQLLTASQLEAHGIHMLPKNMTEGETFYVEPGAYDEPKPKVTQEITHPDLETKGIHMVTKPLKSETLYLDPGSYDEEEEKAYYETGMSKKSAEFSRSTTAYNKRSSDVKIGKRDVNSSAFTAKDVAALEVIVDLIKNTQPYEDVTLSRLLKHNENLVDGATNAIQVHIAIPFDLQDNKKRSLEPARVRKVFSAKMSSPVDLEYQVHSYDNIIETTTTSRFEKMLSPGLYLLINDGMPLPKGQFALKPVYSTVRLSDINIREVNPVTPQKYEVIDTTSASNTSKVTLSKEFLSAINKHLVQLYENLTAVNETVAKPEDHRKKRFAKPRSGVFKKFFGHDRVCSCKCKPNKTMCKACAASDTVISELIFEFENIANYMKDHCTEIQTFFYMNPNGGKQLAEAVHRIDRNLKDYYKRVKNKCQGRTCNSFASAIDKREFNHDKIGRDYIGAPLAKDLMSVAKVIKLAKNANCYNETLNEKSHKLVSSFNTCISMKNIEKRSTFMDHSSGRLCKNVYSLDNINVNIICHPESTTDMIFSASKRKIKSNKHMFHYIIDGLKRKSKGKKDLEYNKWLTYSIDDTDLTTEKSVMVKRHAERGQVESPLIADTGGSFWMNYIKGNRRPTAKVDTKASEHCTAKTTKFGSNNTNETTMKHTHDTQSLPIAPEPHDDEIFTTELSTPDMAVGEDAISENISELLKLFGSLADLEAMKGTFEDTATVTEGAPTKTNESTKSSKGKKTTKSHKNTKGILTHTTHKKMKNKHKPAKNATIVPAANYTLASVAIKPKSTRSLLTKLQITSRSTTKQTKTRIDLTKSTENTSEKQNIFNKIKKGTISLLNKFQKNYVATTEHTATEPRIIRTPESMTIREVDVESNITTSTNPTILIINEYDDISANSSGDMNGNSYSDLLLSIIEHETNKLNNEWERVATKYVQERHTEDFGDNVTELAKSFYNIPLVHRKEVTNDLVLKDAFVSIFKKSTTEKKMKKTKAKTTPATANGKANCAEGDYDIIDTIKHLEVPEPDPYATKSGLFGKIARKFGVKVIHNRMKKKAAKKVAAEMTTLKTHAEVSTAKPGGSTKEAASDPETTLPDTETSKSSDTQTAAQNEASDSRPATKMCDLRATIDHILKLYHRLLLKDFENYVRTIQCYKFKSPPKYFHIKPNDSETTEKRRWDWIRDKRSFSSDDYYFDDEPVIFEEVKSRVHAGLNDDSRIEVNDDVVAGKDEKVDKASFTVNDENETYSTKIITEPIEADGFETFNRDRNGIYKMRKKRNKRTADSRQGFGLKGLPRLRSAMDEIYVMLGDSVTLNCVAHRGRVKHRSSSPPVYSWRGDREDMMRHDNVVVHGPRVSIKKIQPKNVGRYYCNKNNKMKKNMGIYVVTLPSFHVVYTPIYMSDKGCTYNDLHSIHQLGPEISKVECSNRNCDVKVEEPLCLKDREAGKPLMKIAVLVNLEPYQELACSVQCRRDLHTSVTLLHAMNAKILSDVPVVIQDQLENKTLTPSKLATVPIVTHTLRRKDANSSSNYYKLTSNMAPGDVMVMARCPAGYYLIPEQKICATCPRDTCSAKGDNACAVCPRGMQAEPGADSCKLTAARPPRYDWWWYPPCGYCVACVVGGCGCGVCALLALIVHLASRPPPQDTNDTKPLPVHTVGHARLHRRQYDRPLSPSRVILAKFFRPSLSSARATDSQETKFEQWKEKNIPPPLPPIDFE